MNDDRSQHLLKVARGDERADCLLQGGTIIDVFSGTVFKADLALYGGLIAGLGDYQAKEVMDVGGKFICPGFIDGHIHIESTMLTPAELAGVITPRGTTAIVADPHEIANVLGLAGIKYILEASRGLVLDVFLMVPSCVPATQMETAGACLSADDLRTLKGKERVLGLAEVMNYPGVVYGQSEVLDKIAAFSGQVIDGHAPLLSGPALSAYIAMGVGSDHECTRLEEAAEKLRSGMRIMVREGTQAKNLKDILPLITERNSRRFFFVTDDRHPHDLIAEGHLDHVIRKAISLGLDPVIAIQMATLNTAEYFGLPKRGALAPGYRADIAVLDSLEEVRVSSVFKDGKRLTPGEKFREAPSISSYTETSVLDSVHVGSFSREDLRIPAQGGKIKVIGLVPDQIVTTGLTESPRVREGLVISDPERDILKLAVVERHQASGRVGLGMVKGFGLKRGAMASSVAHDSHNIISVGINDEDMAVAIHEVIRMGGGLAVVANGKVLESLPLAIAGLISDLPATEVAVSRERIVSEARGLGAKIEDPFMALSFLALPVIPELRLTDKGLVDVGKFAIVPLFGEDK